MIAPLTLSHSSQARPAPKPRPTNAGHARLLNSRTEKMTPNEAPSVDRMSSVLRQWSHCNKVSIELIGQNRSPSTRLNPRMPAVAYLFVQKSFAHRPVRPGRCGRCRSIGVRHCVFRLQSDQGAPIVLLQGQFAMMSYLCRSDVTGMVG